MAQVYTPLRYPGGKAKLSAYVKELFRLNKLCDGHYVEPYAGGAGVALDMLMTEHAKHIHLNDLNLPLFAFWHSVLNNTEKLCGKIENCTLSVNAWKRHRTVVRNPEEHDFLKLGFAFLFLNRTNRSGIIRGGVIGGLDQSGNYKIDARFNREGLIDRIKKISLYRHRIHIYNLDALDFVDKVEAELPENSLIYLDPPYYNKGQRLYDNHYSRGDHAKVARIVSRLKHKWIVTYDKVPEICDLYKDYRQSTYGLQYSAQASRIGSEVMIYSDGVLAPSLDGYVAA